MAEIRAGGRQRVGQAGGDFKGKVIVPVVSHAAALPAHMR
jgi:hypothetical protein